MGKKTFKNGIVDTMVATGAIILQRFVSGDGDLCSSGEKSPGVSLSSVESGVPVGYALNGVLLVTAGGIVTAGSEVESDSVGRAVNLTTGKPNGVALDDGGLDETIRVAR